MDFYQLEEERLQQDEKDNELIRQLITNYQALKEIIATSQKQREDMHAQIQFLKNQNQTLIEELRTLRQNSQQPVEGANTQPATYGQFYHNKGYAEGIHINSPLGSPTEHAKEHFAQSVFDQKQAFHKTTVGFNRTFDKSAFTQQTKRRVINGLVEELNQELQESEQLLRKERKMQEESRRALQSCHDEVSILRLTVKDLEGKVMTLSLDNEKLCRQLQSALKEKGLLEQKYSLNAIQNRHYRSSLLLNMEEFEEEMDKMDAIYGQIEVELQS